MNKFKNMLIGTSVLAALFLGGTSQIHADSTNVSNVPAISTKGNNNTVTGQALKDSNIGNSVGNSAVQYGTTQKDNGTTSTANATQNIADNASKEASNIAGNGVSNPNTPGIDGFFTRLWSLISGVGGNTISTVVRFAVIASYVVMVVSIVGSIISLIIKKGSPFKWFMAGVGAFAFYIVLLLLGHVSMFGGSLGNVLNWLVTGN